ncbi:hypothetical protein CUMW_174530 [Citrus unshiu]|uniref:Uncharacterized protein n=1 Tax=Citrus unshiu TaxID=55188 RepID=A0A2H5PWN7_CITUN|nr:hypothetical protein CUMW_174530 [Citrus unshiu]
MSLQLHKIHPSNSRHEIWDSGALSNAMTTHEVRMVDRHKPSSKKCLFSKQDAKTQQLQT